MGNRCETCGEHGATYCAHFSWPEMNLMDALVAAGALQATDSHICDERCQHGPLRRVFRSYVDYLEEKVEVTTTEGTEEHWTPVAPNVRHYRGERAL